MSVSSWGNPTCAWVTAGQGEQLRVEEPGVGVGHRDGRAGSRECWGHPGTAAP